MPVRGVRSKSTTLKKGRLYGLSPIPGRACRDVRACRCRGRLQRRRRSWYPPSGASFTAYGRCGRGRRGAWRRRGRSRALEQTRSAVTAGADSCLFISAGRARNGIEWDLQIVLIHDRHADGRIGGGIAEVQPTAHRQLTNLHVSSSACDRCADAQGIIGHTYDGAVQHAHSDACVASASHGVQHRERAAL